MQRLVCLLTAFALVPSISLASVRLAPGEVFPVIRFDGLVMPEDYANLDLPRPEGPFLLSEIPGDVLVLELFNKQCLPCRRQVRYAEAFFQELRAAGLGARVRLLGLAEGNAAKYFPPFRKKYKLNFPIATDPKFKYWREFGAPGRTPLTIFLVRRDADWVLAQAHAGAEYKDWLMTAALAHLRGEAVVEVEDRDVVEQPADWPPPLERDEEREVAEKLLRRAAGSDVSVQTLEIGEGVRVFRATLPDGSEHIYARLARREPLCEICHGVYFCFAFDASGRIRGFEPIFAGKWGNVPWDPSDIDYFEARLWGRNMAELAFDEKVDTVARATVSSAVIFDEIRNSLELLKTLEGR